MVTLQTAPQGDCGCKKKEPVMKKNRPPISKGRMVLFAVLGGSGWFLLYKQLLPFSLFLAYTLLELTPESRLGGAVQFFVYDAPKVMLLLTLFVPAQQFRCF